MTMNYSNSNVDVHTARKITGKFLDLKKINVCISLKPGVCVHNVTEARVN